MGFISRLFSCFFTSKSSPSARPQENTIFLSANRIYSRSNSMESFPKCRLEKELEEMKRDQPTHCTFGPVDDDIFHWQGTIVGPIDTPFEGGIFILSIHIPFDYPFVPPEIKFLTKVYHPNVDADGKIDIDILYDEWTPALTIEKLVLSVCSLLPHPTPENHHNPISDVYWNERHKYDKTAREWTRKFAMG